MNPFRRYLSRCLFALLAWVSLTAQVPLAPGVRIAHPDHHEFEAALWAPFVGELGEARTFKVGFGFLDAEALTVGAWRLELVDTQGLVRGTWHGETFLVGGSGSQRIAWDGKDAAGRALERGFYTLRLTSKPMAQAAYRYYPGGNQPDRVEAHLATSIDEAATEETTICVGPAPRLKVPALDLPVSAGGFRPALAPGSAPAPASLPYTIYFGNMHSQTNHSDGGTAPASCSGSEVPQGGTSGPAIAYEMMRVQAGGDFLLTSEHNHMFDGSTGTNTAMDPADPNHGSALFASGLAAASTYRTDHPGFLAMYGMEWGVINNGGHLNIINPDGLATWEYNASGQLLGDYFTTKSDYPPLYTFMKSKGWVGQFNHPSSSQFGTLVYTADGDEVMALCEVMNTNAFSPNTTESETRRSFYTSTWNKILEAGYHVAPTTDQDNHCSNWGLSYPNRTGVLLPTGTTLTLNAFVNALKARHAFATMDKSSQIMLTAGSAIMGDRINNSGSLTLNVYFSSTNVLRSASSIKIWEGVPGRNGTVTQLSDGLSTLTITPTAGEHFYYASIIQDNGDSLWSAPIWVSEAAGAVSASITSPSATVTVATGTNVAFTGSATTTHTSITNQDWTFGDGGTGTGPSVNHTFVNGGAAPTTFTVTYTATDDLGATGSATRLVIVNPSAASNTAPTITAIPAQITQPNVPILGIPFTVGDAESAASALTVTAVTTVNPTLIPNANLALGGSSASLTLDITPAPDLTGSATVRVTVTDPEGLSSFRDVAVTVGASSGQSKLIITQFYEGSSGTNKWIEITNVGTGAYDGVTNILYIGLWSNPQGWVNASPKPAAPLDSAFQTTFPIPAMAAGETRLFKNTATVTPSAANVTGTPTNASSVANFNGDDIFFITTEQVKGYAGYLARTDVVGEPTVAWVGTTTTASGPSVTSQGKDTSYFRNFAVTTPNPTYTFSEWTIVTPGNPPPATTSLAAVNAGGTAILTDRLGVHIYNHAPTISDIPSQTTNTNTVLGSVAFTVNDTELPLSLALSATSSNPSLIPAASIIFGGSAGSPTLTLTPVADQSGTSLVTITVTDAFGASASDNFIFTVNGQPVAGAQSLSTDEDTALPITLTGSDPEGSALAFTVVTNPTHGALAGTVPNLTYTPSANYSGPDSFTFKVNDGALDSLPVTISLTVNPVNDAPIAGNDVYAVPTYFAFTVPAPGVLGNDTDVDGPALSAILVSGPAHGTLSLASDGSFTYTPSSTFSGTDTFTYRASDGSLTSNLATVTLNVNLLPACALDISGFSPSSGPAGTVVTLTGGNFTGLTAVRFNGLLAAFTVLSPTQVQATVPAGATSGRILLTTATCYGFTSEAFTVVSLAPVITSFSPSSGPVGTEVTILGSNFTGTTAVRFNGVSAAFTLVSATQLKAIVPAGATYGPITVTNPSGTGNSGFRKFKVY
ncbi:MAG: tandem-95 repeat protein [Holophagaceae bacterium]|nr:tandem-95 repeat protein [Holophagaceae bacterium]